MSDDPNPDNLKPGPMTVAQNDAALEALLNELTTENARLKLRAAITAERQAMWRWAAFILGFALGALPVVIVVTQEALQW